MRKKTVGWLETLWSIGVLWYHTNKIKIKKSKYKWKIQTWKETRFFFVLYQPQLGLIVLVSAYVVGLTFNFKCKYFYKNVYFLLYKKKFMNCIGHIYDVLYEDVFITFIYFILPSTRFGEIMWFFKYYIFPP